MPHPLLRLLLAIPLIGIPSISAAQQNLDIIQIMAQFVQANHAASKCSKPDQQTLAKFNSNFKTVTARATEEAMKRKPEITEDQVSEAFKKGSDAVAKKIDEVISAKGCSDPRIQDLLKRFEIQANLNL